MPFRFGFRILMLAACTVLLAGCRTSSDPASTSTSTQSSTRPTAQAGNASDDESADTQPVSEKELIEAHAHYAQAVVYELNDDMESALKEYYEAALRDPGNETLVLDVSRRFLQARQPEKALELVSRATSQPRASGALYARLGLVYLQLDKTDLAIKANRTAIKKQPRSLSGYRNLFLVYMKLKQPQDALAALDDAAKVSSPSVEYLVELGELYSNLALQMPAQWESARTRGRAVLQRAVKMNVTEPQLRVRMADAFNLLGDDQAAAAIYQDLLKELPDLPLVRENLRSKLMDIYLRGHDYTNAVTQLENAIRDNPTDAQAYYLLGNIVYEDKNYARAAECFSKTILLAPEFEQAYYELAGAQLAGDKTDDALATLQRAREKFSKNSQNFALEYFTGLAYSRRKDYTNALYHFNSAEIIGQAKDPKKLDEGFYFQLGSTCERKGDFAQAEKYFEKCLALSPNFAEAQNYLGYMWADRGEKLDRARDLITKALKAEPKNAAYLDSMAWVLFKLQQPKEALEYILDAIKNSEEEDATVYDHLGDIYSALNQPDKAREGWQKSLSLENNETVRKKLEVAPAK